MLFLVCISECLLYFGESYLSKDIAHLKSIDNFVKQDTDIMIIGNSLTRDGINESILKDMLIPNKLEIGKVSIIYLDDTSIIEWYYIFKSYFYDNGNYPRKLILNFALNQLSSQKLEFEELSRISSYVPFKKLHIVCKEENLDHVQIVDIYLSKSFRLFAHRQRIAKRILDFIPNYRETIRKLNSMNKDKNKKQENLNYKHLMKIIDMIEMSDIEMTFCAMPLPENYKIDKKIISKIESSKNCKIIKYNKDNSFKNYHFKDGYHLNPNGAKIFTKSFAKKINQ